MKRVGSILICLASGLVLSAISRADDVLPADNPYGSIVKRNIFGLNPIPPPAAVTPDAGPPPPKITLTGIMTLFGKPEALYKVAGVRRGDKPPQDESYIFTEGESEDDVEVMAIDVKKNNVTFNNHGVTQDIALTAGQASAGTAPSQPAFTRPFTRPFLRGGFPGAPGGPAGGPGGYQRPFGNRTPGNTYNQSGFNGNNNNGTFNNSLPQGLTGDDQQALIAAQHAQAEQEGNPMSAIFPPTKYDGPAGVHGGSAPSAGPPAP